MSSRKAQLSMEYMAVVGFVAIMVIPMTFIYLTYSGQTEDQISSTQVLNIAQKVRDTAESVYYLGEPSKTKIRTYFPEDIENISVLDYELVFYMHTKNGVDEVVVTSSVNMTGTLAPTSGIHNIVIQSMGPYVQITG